MLLACGRDSDFFWEFANEGDEAVGADDTFMRPLSADFLMESVAGDWVIGSSPEEYIGGPYSTVDSGGWRFEAETALFAAWRLGQSSLRRRTGAHRSGHERHADHRAGSHL